MIEDQPLRMRTPRKSVRQTIPMWARLARVMATSYSKTGSARVERIPPGPVDDRLHQEIQQFQRAVETTYFGSDPMTCEHGRDYTLLLRSVGKAHALSVRDRTGRLIGLMSLTGKRLRLPDGGTRRVMYVAHLRVLPECRSGMALPVLAARSVQMVLLGGGVIVGLTRIGGRFTAGKVSRVLGLPVVGPNGTVRLLTYLSDSGVPVGADREGSSSDIHDATEREVRDRFRALTTRCISCVGGNPSMRSALPPRWLMASDGSACGCIEDYHASARWIRADGTEFRQSNISFFGWRDSESAARFVRACLREAHRMRVERLRILLDERLAAPIVAGIGIEPWGDFRWTVCVGGLRRMPDAPWVLHPSEL